MDLNGDTEWIPRIGIRFDTTEEGWLFWNKYAGKISFNARKYYNNRRHLDGKTTSTKFVCSNEGFRSKDKRDDQTKCPRLQTRTGCSCSLILKLVRESDKYEVTDFISERPCAAIAASLLFVAESARSKHMLFFQLYFLDVNNNLLKHI
jgi:zinc finger SWIM domain-containing protein 3